MWEEKKIQRFNKFYSVWLMEWIMEDFVNHNIPLPLSQDFHPARHLQVPPPPLCQLSLVSAMMHSGK